MVAQRAQHPYDASWLHSIASQLCRVTNAFCSFVLQMGPGLAGCHGCSAPSGVMAALHQIDVAVQAISGMHGRHIAWGDGKPANVLCSGCLDSPGLRITLCDFASSCNFDDGKISRAHKHSDCPYPCLNKQTCGDALILFMLSDAVRMLARSMKGPHLPLQSRPQVRRCA